MKTAAFFALMVLCLATTYFGQVEDLAKSHELLFSNHRLIQGRVAK